ncbi:putative bifunctional enzyme HhdD isomerase + cyclase/dehydrase domain protein [Mycobacteroides abscessus subsp. bolletii 1513]|uniref:Putative bifunctional enzyme HhdD isomerase + cyclase/dehydrase domain protein n=1 Tax=Mycobacteroides abscessus subsp. bolletii 1513 TaxID=1299321 RepID=X8DQC6_9MYCO|nr:putative bifunctional enzyme HhdD isomerase + cyclase/dehydrase domain protein [Mycobacteroides abscessus subsp. bolletii 1513]
MTAIYHERNPEIPFQSLTQALESISGQLAKAAAGGPT